MYFQVFKEAMQEILLCPIEEFDSQIVVVKIMEKVNKYQGCEFDYRVFDAKDGHPVGTMYMAPYWIRQILRYGYVTTLDWQLKKRINMDGCSVVQLVQTRTKNCSL